VSGVNVIQHLTTVQFASGSATGHNPDNATTYGFGLSPQFTPFTALGAITVPSPLTGTVLRCYVRVAVSGTLGSAGNVAVNVHNVTGGTNESVGNVVMTATTNNLSNEALTLAVTKGNQLEIRFTTPTWVTKPTAVTWTVTLVLKQTE
jgi:hypothetical protein